MGYRFTADSWLQPDVSITHAGQRGDDYFLGALAVEVVSERNTASQMNGKIAEHLAQGGDEVWVLYPNRGNVWVYRTDGTAVVHSGMFRSDVLGGAAVNVAEFFHE